MNAHTIVFLALITSRNFITPLWKQCLLFTKFACKSQTLSDFSTVFTNTDCSHAKRILFNLVDSNLTAKEGSCAEIKCKVTSTVDDSDAYWFWMKDALWNYAKEEYVNATVIYSTNKSLRPVSPDFATRVTYNGSSSSNWQYTSSSPKLCNILICDLNTTDSGNYLFRFLGKDKWVTKPLNLTVKGKNKRSEYWKIFSDNTKQ